jgi:hypothetical protein
VNLKIRKVLGIFSRFAAFGNAFEKVPCARCGVTWKFTKHHATKINENVTDIVLCEYCFKSLSPHERLPFYKMWYDRRSAFTKQEDWNDYETAVLRENGVH